MKLGLGLYKSLLTDDNFYFAKQAGATHVVVQLVDYVKGGNNPSLTQSYINGWGITENEHHLWEYEDLKRLKKQIESHGLTWEAIENFDPSHWYDVLLDGPKKDQQLENIKQFIHSMGKLGIPVMGYYFSLAGVWGWTGRASGRGGARSVEFDATAVDLQQLIPKGMVWNMVYDTSAPEGAIGPVSRKEMWQRLKYFLEKVMPVAEENNVKLVAHPDDPPLPELRQTARLFYASEEYEKLLDWHKSPSNGFEFCMGTIQEMKNGDVYQLLDQYSRKDKIGYIHFRNVKGKVPHYREVFIDEGDIDMVKALKILKRNNYNGVLIPDHTPEMSCAAPWHAGMAFALGFMRGAINALEHAE
jgi:mannonate dehydratase